MTRNNPPKIQQWYRYRVAALAGLALYCLRFGATYTPFLSQNRAQPAAINWITAFFPDKRPGWEPVWILGAVWIVLGLLAVAAVRWQKLHNAAFIAGAASTFYWTAAYFVNQFSIDKAPGINDSLTAVFLLCGTWFIVLLGLLTRPDKEDEAVRPTSPPGFDRPDVTPGVV